VLVDGRSVLGIAGEEAAARCLEHDGFEIVERNWRVPEGEVDLIARRADVVVFCEVKTRRTDRWGDPSEAVAPLKQARLRRLAARWLRERRPGFVSVRFDVVSVIVRDGRTEVRHIPDAF
jgi:putative endonuclease